MTTTLIRQPVLETARLTLRKPQKGDIGLVSLYTSDLRVAQWTTTIPHPNPPGSVEAFFETLHRPETTEMVWIMDATRGFDTSVVGCISLRPDGDIGYWVAPFFWGMGLASEALARVVAFAETERFPLLRARVFQENFASRRVLEKVGFKVTGVGQSYSVARGDCVDTWNLIRERDDGL